MAQKFLYHFIMLSGLTLTPSFVFADCPPMPITCYVHDDFWGLDVIKQTITADSKGVGIGGPCCVIVPTSSGRTLEQECNIQVDSCNGNCKASTNCTTS